MHLDGLIVDPDVARREVLRHSVRALGFFGFEVMAADVAEVSAHLVSARATTNCIIADLDLPEDGFARLVQLVRSRPRYRNFAMIGISREAGPAGTRAAFDRGASQVLPARFTHGEVRTALLGAQQFLENGRLDTMETQAAAAEMHFAGRRDFLGQTAFEAMLREEAGRMSGGGLFAARIDAFEAIAARCGADELDYCLSVAVSALERALSGMRKRYTYFGDGYFLVHTPEAALHETAALEAVLQDALDAWEIALSDGDPLDLEISLGVLVRAVRDAEGGPDRALRLAMRSARLRARQRAAPGGGRPVAARRRVPLR